MIGPSGGPKPSGSFGSLTVPGPAFVPTPGLSPSGPLMLAPGTSGFIQQSFGTPGFSTTFNPFQGYYVQPSFQTTINPFGPGAPLTGTTMLNGNIPLYSYPSGGQLSATGRLQYLVYPTQGPLTGTVGVQGTVPLFIGPLGGQYNATGGVQYPVYPTQGALQYNYGFQYQLQFGGPRPQRPFRILPGLLGR